MRTQRRAAHSITPVLLGVLILVFTFSLGNRAATAAIVDIPDPGLEAAIRAALGAPTDPITDTDLASLSMLAASGRGIVDLTGLECCVGLDSLDLSDNHISDLGPLSGLTDLFFLGLSDNHISDLGPLSGLFVETLYLSGNRIRDLGPLSGFYAKTLDLSDNHISDLGPLSDVVPLYVLHLENNRISDIQALVANPLLANGHKVGLEANPLSCKAICTDIPILLGRAADVTFDPVVSLDVEIYPPILNLKSKEEWITCSIRSPKGCDVGDIDVASIRLEDSLEVQRSSLPHWWGLLTVKFDRSEVEAMLGPGETELTLTGEFTCGARFEGSDTIRVIDPGKKVGWFLNWLMSLRGA